MMRFALLIAALLLATAGCDDPAVRDRIESVLDYGVTQAEALCTVDAASSNINHVCAGARPLKVKVNLLQDESSIVTVVGNNVRLTEFIKRGEIAQVCDRFVNGVEADVCVELDSGNVVLDSTAACNPNVGSPPPYSETRSIDTYCTGFNLEAFD